MEALARRLESSVAKSLYSEASAVGAAPPLDGLEDELEPHDPGHLELGGQLGQALADDRVVLQRHAVARRRPHVLDEQLEALLHGREGEHGEALEVERLRDVLEPAAHLPHHVVVGDEDVVEEHLVGALVAHGPDGVDRDAGLVDRDEEQA